jgi:hypothetical protein
MNGKTDEVSPIRRTHILRVLALIIVVVLVLIMLWCVRETPLPYKFP